MYTHHQREQIAAEVHARLFQTLEAPLSVLHIVVLYDGKNPADIEQSVLDTVRNQLFDVPLEHQGFLFCRQGKHAIRYEPHNEFYSLTCYRFDHQEPLPLADSWLTSLPGALLSGVEILLCKKSRPLRLGRSDSPIIPWQQTEQGMAQTIGSRVLNGAAVLMSDYDRQTDTGFTRFLIEDHALSASEAGRLVQRLCEIESYRNMALLSLPLARSLMPKLTQLDVKLAELSQRSLDEDLSDMLARLMALAAEVEAISAETANRFGASDAYFTLVERGMKELGEKQLEGKLTMRGFVERHLDPARRTCRSAAMRTELLSKRIARATELIQSQVNLAIENQNQELLEALNKRDHHRLRLQAKLEGLSVVVVAYYLYDLSDLVLKNLFPEGEQLAFFLTLLTAALPVITIGIYLYVRRIMKPFHED